MPFELAVSVPAGVDEAEVRRRLLEEHTVEIGAAFGELAGKVWRVGLMGHSARVENIVHFLDGLEAVLGEPSGHPAEAARKVLS